MAYNGTVTSLKNDTKPHFQLVFWYNRVREAVSVKQIAISYSMRKMNIPLYKKYFWWENIHYSVNIRHLFGHHTILMILHNRIDNCSTTYRSQCKIILLLYMYDTYLASCNYILHAVLRLFFPLFMLISNQ